MHEFSSVQVDVTQAGFPNSSIPSPEHHLLAMGTSLQTRTCALQGVVRFTSIGGEAVAQLDPNYRDPTTGQPLCFPLSAMVFFAGVVSGEGVDEPISRSVALQIEPHGRMRVLGPVEPTDIDVR